MSPRENSPKSMVSTPWTDAAMAYILEVTEYRSRAALLTPAILALLATVVSSLERDGVDADLVLLAKGQDLLKEYARKDPAAYVIRNV